MTATQLKGSFPIQMILTSCSASHVGMFYHVHISSLIDMDHDSHELYSKNMASTKFGKMAQLNVEIFLIKVIF